MRKPVFILAFFVVVWLLLLATMLTGCTYIPQKEQQESAESQTTTLPASVVCILAACDTVFSDRSHKAQQDSSESGDEEIDQEATSTPTLEIPAEAL